MAKNWLWVSLQAKNTKQAFLEALYDYCGLDGLLGSEFCGIGVGGRVGVAAGGLGGAATAGATEATTGTGSGLITSVLLSVTANSKTFDDSNTFLGHVSAHW